MYKHWICAGIAAGWFSLTLAAGPVTPATTIKKECAKPGAAKGLIDPNEKKSGPRGVIGPNDRTLIDPNDRAVIDPNEKPCVPAKP